jgi:hypothetical protein
LNTYVIILIMSYAITFAFVANTASGVPRNFVGGGGGSTNSVEDREKGDLGAAAP